MAALGRNRSRSGHRDHPGSAHGEASMIAHGASDGANPTPHESSCPSSLSGEGCVCERRARQQRWFAGIHPFIGLSDTLVSEVTR